MKKCTKCQIEKELTEFYRRNATKSGYEARCKKCINEYEKETKIKRDEYRKQYNKNNKNIISKQHKEYYIDNKNSIIKYNLLYKKEKLKTDPIFKLTQYMRTAVWLAFKRLGSIKPTRTEQILGCTFEQFKQHIESQFEPWMNWENQGKFNGESNYGWDLDHKIPISSAKTKEDVIKLSHYTNFQPLCSYTNRFIKRNNKNNNE